MKSTWRVSKTAYINLINSAFKVMGKEHILQLETFKILALPFTSIITLGKLLKLSGFSFFIYRLS